MTSCGYVIVDAISFEVADAAMMCVIGVGGTMLLGWCRRRCAAT